MLAYIARRLLLIIPTLLGIMVINFAIIQAAPGGPVEQMIARIKGTAVEATARVGGAGRGGTGGRRPVPGGARTRRSDSIKTESRRQHKSHCRLLLLEITKPS